MQPAYVPHDSGCSATQLQLAACAGTPIQCLQATDWLMWIKVRRSSLEILNRVVVGNAASGDICIQQWALVGMLPLIPTLQKLSGHHLGTSHIVVEPPPLLPFPWGRLCCLQELPLAPGCTSDGAVCFG
jgi:hypothetical protein